jgi:serine/threonine protein phosphatase PrpC
MAPTPEITVEVFGRTDVGLVREHNEDNYLVADLTRHERSLKPEARQYTLGDAGALFVVCDGMGGAVCGEVASQMATDTIYDLVQKGAPGAAREVFARRLRGAVQEANRGIYAYARADHSRAGMGTTCTAAGLVDGHLVLAQIGDSRGYLLRGGVMTQVTRDQSLANQLIEAGQMTPEEAREFEHANIILQALGVMERVDVVLTEVALRRGDILMLCSDGLSGPVQDADIRVLLAGAPDPMEACKRLTEASRTNGAPDNVTVVVARFGGAGLPEPGADETVRYQPYNPGPGDGDEVDTGLAAALAAAAAGAVAGPPLGLVEPTARLEMPGAPGKPTAAGFHAVGVTPDGGGASAPAPGEAGNPGAALAATAGAFGPPTGTSGVHRAAGPAAGLTMVPGQMMGWVAPAPPPGVNVATLPAAAPAPPAVQLAPASTNDDDLEIPRRGFPVVPVLIVVFLVAVLVGVGGFWLLRTATHGEARARVARPPDAGRPAVVQPVAAADGQAPASQAPASQAASRPSSQAASQPTSTPAKQPAAEK